MPLPVADPDDPDSIGSPRVIGLLTLASIISAVAIGFLGGAFRWLLEQAVRGRDALVSWTHDVGGWTWLLPVVMAVAGALIGRAVVGISPRAAGSGIQDVEAVWRREADPPSAAIVPVKFVGGLASIGVGGLVLGREGPTVHMGSTIGAAVGRRLGLDDADRRTLYATVGGAGLAVAFNAPIGGALFALEEVTRTFKVRLTLITIFCTSIAVACSRLIIGDRPDFIVGPVTVPPLGMLAVFLVFGGLTGLLGVVYNKLVVSLLTITDRMHRVGPVTRAGLIGAVIGVLLWLDPLTVGGGDQLAQLLLTDHPFPFGILVAYLAVRFLVGPLSYTAGTPGGLFAPLLAVGALWGNVFHGLLTPIAPVGESAVPLAIVGMTAFFAATVRAPITGIVLIIEMTATTTLTVPMLAACAAATLVAYLVHGAPVYDSLRERMLGLGSDQPRSGTS
ncbi:MAG: ClC family H(+)/Cl(-) exchange transporter [Propionibacteriaceae bacterium]